MINLTFHGIGAPGRPLDAGEAAVWVAADRYHAVLDAVRDRDDVRITFDDGNASDLEHGLPALLERGLTGTFFVVAGRVGAPGYLSAADVRTLADAGMRIGSHGMRHRAWRGLDDAALGEELVAAKQELEQRPGRAGDRGGVPVRQLRPAGARRAAARRLPPRLHQRPRRRAARRVAAAAHHDRGGRRRRDGAERARAARLARPAREADREAVALRWP